MLLLVILARACGCETRKDIVAFGTIHLSYLQDHLGILAKGCPSEPTLCRMGRWNRRHYFGLFGFDIITKIRVGA